MQGKHNATTSRIRYAQGEVKKFQDKMRELESLSVNASTTAAAARGKLEGVKENITDNIYALDELEKLIKETISNSSTKREGADLHLTDATTAFDSVKDQSDRLNSFKQELENGNRLGQTEHRETSPVVSAARGNLGRLQAEAERLDRMFKPTRNAAAAGKKAANVYDDVVDDVNDAKVAHENATVLLAEITTVSTNIGANVRDSVQTSEALSGQADQTKIDALKLRGTVENNQNSGAIVKDQNVRTETGKQEHTQYLVSFPFISV